MGHFKEQLANSKKMLVIMAALFVMTLVVDQATKVHSESYKIRSSSENFQAFDARSTEIFTLGTAFTEDGSYFMFRFTYYQNPGMGWSALGAVPNAVRIPIFLLLIAAALIVLGIAIFRTPVEFQRAKYGYVLIAAGAIGNLIDRLRLGFVVDQLDFKWRIFGWYYDFPVFNPADIAIFVGVVWSSIYTWKTMQDRERQKSDRIQAIREEAKRKKAERRKATTTEASTE